ncbi:hypothetical protein [Gillisia sp. JM1]|uniref:hypothetical protein n=1 Tax=Gillisia sp. JM1 TaxID=1283286 RepID=UPI00041F1697|nr:hypothetical protein [Gillisia sp. JM1]
MKIRQAYQEDLLKTKALTEACAVRMQQLGIIQWNEHYPSLEKLQQDIDHTELYGIKPYYWGAQKLCI